MLPSLSLTDSVPSTVDVLVLGVKKGPDGPELASEDGQYAALAGSLAGIGSTGASDELLRVPASTVDGPSLALIGLGSNPDARALRAAAGSATRQLRGIRSVAFQLPASSDADVIAIAEGALIGAYRYTTYRSASLESTKTPADEVTVVAAVTDADAVKTRALATATAISQVRDLVNAPPSHLYPATFADTALELAAGLPVEVTVLTEPELADGGYGGILGVGQGSTRGPRMVKVTYQPEGAAKHLALVGKGITFDSGGLSLKPAASMVGMKEDMTGAATALAVVLAAARIGLNVRLTAWLCLAENLPSGSAIRPNDVLTMRGGTTVEVLNTDAEGRLVLADGLVAASEEQPDAIIDVATLTGAALVALGDRVVGAMGDADLVRELVDVADAQGEEFWHMPLPGHLREILNSDVADIVNSKPGNRNAGMLVGGVFLKEFIGTRPDGTPIPWAHLDIAGPASTSSPRGFLGKGPSGVTVLTLVALADRYSRA
ncbi:leucyl aminopeptidase [Diaminobutyricimonas sp. LJ205]|uniref:leucyl aminopeptidase n=1 Tax=Diaminobutyricimonas sp. LJ205 TaxID=2683590 RepID=UPI0012F4F477|nr:leucyl aminopeptidase [Diaminobutyricimonas sp. LJ205]